MALRVAELESPGQRATLACFFLADYGCRKHFCYIAFRKWERVTGPGKGSALGIPRSVRRTERERIGPKEL
jgi:hypothetical protein